MAREFCHRVSVHHAWVQGVRYWLTALRTPCVKSMSCMHAVSAAFIVDAAHLLPTAGGANV